MTHSGLWTWGVAWHSPCSYFDPRVSDGPCVAGGWGEGSFASACDSPPTLRYVNKPTARRIDAPYPDRLARALYSKNHSKNRCRHLVVSAGGLMSARRASAPTTRRTSRDPAMARAAGPLSWRGGISHRIRLSTRESAIQCYQFRGTGYTAKQLK
jgi:hypothetical protein